jgi:hypothetical protein
MQLVSNFSKEVLKKKKNSVITMRNHAIGNSIALQLELKNN